MKCYSFLLLASVAIWISPSDAERTYLKHKSGKLKSSNGFPYFVDSSEQKRTWVEAEQFCKDEDGELATIPDRKSFNYIRLSIPRGKIGKFWINGREKNSTDRFDFMRCNKSMPYNFPEFIAKMEPRNLRLDGTSCLAFMKGESLNTTLIESVQCAEMNWVICALVSDPTLCKNSTGNALPTKAPQTEETNGSILKWGE